MKKNNTAFNLYKNIVNNSANIGAIPEAIKNAYKIDPEQSIKWFEKLTKEKKESSSWFYIQHAIFELLPEITKKNNKYAIKIFSNLLIPEFEEESSILPYEKPRKHVKRRWYAFTDANETIRELFILSPKEYLSTVLKLVLLYHQVPLKKKSMEIQDSYSIIWYRDEAHYEEVKLLKTIEREAVTWAHKSDPRLNEVIQTLEESNFSISVRILIKILRVKPKQFGHNLLLLIPKIISTNDCLDLLPDVINDISQYLNKSEITKLNNFLLTVSIPKWLRKYASDSYRKYLLISIPEEYRNYNVKKWIKNIGKNAEEWQLRRPPQVFTTKHEPETQKRKFTDLTDKEQEIEINKMIEATITFTKDDKIKFLRNVEEFLNKDKKKIKKDVVLRLQPLIWAFCNDPDPEVDESPDDKTGDILISYPTIRAYAASCLVRLSWHNPILENIEIIKKMSDDKVSFVREEICKNLRFLSEIDYPLCLNLAKKFLDDNWRVQFFIPDFLHFNVLKHTDDVYELCEKIIEKSGKSNLENKETPLEFTISLITQMAIVFDKPKFNALFNKLVNDESYNYTVKHTIAFRCKDEKILFDKKLRNKVLTVYHKLATSTSSKIRSDAEFFLLYSIIQKNQSFLPEIKPVLQTLSDAHYDLSTSEFYKLNIVEYIEKFWKEIPDESAEYLHRIYLNNEKLAFNFHRSCAVIKLIETMYLSGKLSTKSQKLIFDVLLEFVKAGWPEASLVLKNLESKAS
ncbi:MAG: hypothetical protein ACT4N5_01450 [Nitrosopumilaceae archaeon]